MKKWMIIIFMLFLAPLCGELLSGSATPAEFFNPLMLTMFILIYGCGALVIRELKAKWNLQWSVIFLAIAYGIVEEGIMIKSFFNPQWIDASNLSAYGMYLGIQVPWTINLLIFHSIMSILIPIFITDTLWPEHKNKKLMKKKGLAIAIIGIIVVSTLGLLFSGNQTDNENRPFQPDIMLIIGSIISVAVLAILAYVFRNSKIETKFKILPRFFLFILGFILFFFVLIITNNFAEAGYSPAITILYQLFLISILILFSISQILSENTSRKHIVSFISGIIAFFILFGFIKGFSSNDISTIISSAVFIVLFIFWRLKIKKSKNTQIEHHIS